MAVERGATRAQTHYPASTTSPVLASSVLMIRMLPWPVDRLREMMRSSREISELCCHERVEPDISWV